MHKLKLYQFLRVFSGTLIRLKATIIQAYSNTGLSIFTHHRGSHCEITQTRTYRDIQYLLINCLGLQHGKGESTS